MSDVARLHNIKSAGLRLGVSRTHIFKLIASGQLRSVKIGSRRLVPEQAIVDFINELDADAGGHHQPDALQHNLVQEDGSESLELRRDTTLTMLKGSADV